MAIDLSGSWRAAIADDELRRDGVGLEFDDDGWERVSVPGHWRSVPAFADTDGPLIYRTNFELDPDPEPGTRHWVTFDGVFYQADVWMDGAYLGDPEGYFFPHSYDISSLAGLGREHVLAVEVSCAPQRDKGAKRNLTGIFQHWDCMDPEWNPGGIWRPVRIETTGPVRIETLRVLARDVNDARAHVVVRASHGQRRRPSRTRPHARRRPARGVAGAFAGARIERSRVEHRRRAPAHLVAVVAR